MAEFKYDVITTDVLVIGGGGAGAKAALEAYKAGANVVLALKGKLGESGATCHRVSNSSGLQAATGENDSDDSPEQHYQDIVNAALGVCKPSLARLVAENAPRIVCELESMGIKFAEKDGRKLVFKGCHSSRSRAHSILGHGHSIVLALKKCIEASNIKLLEQTFIIDLIIDEQGCHGAVGLTQNGEFTAVIAQKTILASGGAGGLFKYNFNPVDITGDGYAMGFRAGASLANLEFVQIGFGIVNPAVAMLSTHVWWHRPKMYNAYGKEFLNRYLPEGVSQDACMRMKINHFPFSSRDYSKYLEISVMEEVKDGRGTERKGIYLDFTHTQDNLPSDITEADERRWELTKELLKGKGIDISARPVEVSLFCHAFNGGLVIDEHGETNVPNLYAIGETAAGPHGADRLGGNMMVTGQIFGEISGKHAAAEVRNRVNPPRESTVRGAFSRALVYEASNMGVINISNLRERLQRVVWDALLIRNEESLTAIVKEIKFIQDELLPRAAVSDVKELQQYLELDNLLTVGYLFVKAALVRKESRGSHYRPDYPLEDPAQAAPIIIKRCNDDLKIDFGAFEEI